MDVGVGDGDWSGDVGMWGGGAICYRYGNLILMIYCYCYCGVLGAEGEGGRLDGWKKEKYLFLRCWTR